MVCHPGTDVMAVRPSANHDVAPYFTAGIKGNPGEHSRLDSQTIEDAGTVGAKDRGVISAYMVYSVRQYLQVR